APCQPSTCVDLATTFTNNPGLPGLFVNVYCDRLKSRPAASLRLRVGRRPAQLLAGHRPASSSRRR
ncbi:MAG: hypothetical protein AB7T19_00940, partial [Planctomycetota bacterium]